MHRNVSRALFENYAARVELPLQQSEWFEYEDPETEAAWRAWQAAIERIAKPQAEALKCAREALDYYAHMFPGIEIRDGGDKAAEALAVVNGLDSSIDR